MGYRSASATFRRRERTKSSGSPARVIIAGAVPDKKLYDRHERPRRVRADGDRFDTAGTWDRRGKSGVDSREPYQGSSVYIPLGWQGWTVSKLRPVDSYELPKVRYDSGSLHRSPDSARSLFDRHRTLDPCPSLISLTCWMDR